MKRTAIALLFASAPFAAQAVPPCLKDPTQLAFMKNRTWTAMDADRTDHGWTYWLYCKRPNNQRPRPYSIICKHGVCDTAAIPQAHVSCKAQTAVSYWQCMSDKWEAAFASTPKPGSLRCARFTNETEAELALDPSVMDANNVWQPSTDTDFNAACAEGLALIKQEWPDAPTPIPPPPPPVDRVLWSCTFATSPTECGFSEQAKVAGRATVVNNGRDGATGLRLHTEPGDSVVAGSDTSERNDVTLSQVDTDCYEGNEQWWAHSILFPNGYVIPPADVVWNWGVVMDFHHTGPTGQANFQVVSTPTGLVFQGFGGPTVANSPSDPGFYGASIGPVTKNTWYDFIYHVKWSSASDGFFDAWVNGAQKLHWQGPTLYSGMGCYLKLANYHTALGVPVSVIHDRVMRGTSMAAVAIPAAPPPPSPPPAPPPPPPPPPAPPPVSGFVVAPTAICAAVDKDAAGKCVTRQSYSWDGVLRGTLAQAERALIGSPCDPSKGPSPYFAFTPVNPDSTLSQLPPRPDRVVQCVRK